MSPDQILAQNPHMSPNTTSLRREVFKALSQLIKLAWAQRERIQLDYDAIRRQILGAGWHYTVAVKEQLLAVALSLWLHLALYPREWMVLHHIHVSVLTRFRRRVMVTLQQVSARVPAWPVPTPGARRSVDEVIQVFTALTILRQSQAVG